LLSLCYNPLGRHKSVALDYTLQFAPCNLPLEIADAISGAKVLEIFEFYGTYLRLGNLADSLGQ